MPADGMGRMGGVWGCDVKAGQEKKKKAAKDPKQKALVEGVCDVGSEC